MHFQENSITKILFFKILQTKEVVFFRKTRKFQLDREQIPHFLCITNFKTNAIMESGITIYSASAHEKQDQNLMENGKLRCPCTFEKFTGSEKLGPGTILILDVGEDRDLVAC